METGMSLQQTQRLHKFLSAAGIFSSLVFVLAILNYVDVGKVMQLQDHALGNGSFHERPQLQAQDPRDFYLRNSSRPLNLTIPKNRPDFQAVKGLGSIRYVHSALWQGDNVRITVVKKAGGNMTNILCMLWYPSDQNSDFVTVKASVTDLQNFRIKNACAYVKCPLWDVKGVRNKEVPLYVGLVNRERMSRGHRILLPVENRDMDPSEVFKQDIVSSSRRVSDSKATVVEFTVCVPTMFNYKNAAQLVEKLEMVRLLGAGRVVLYKTSVGENVEKVLRLYTSEWAAGRETMEVIVHSWTLPPTKLHYRGQMATVDDCHHRYGWVSRYMVFDDLDELIIPLRHANWSQLIADRTLLKPDTAGFMFRCSMISNDRFSPASGFEQAETSRYGSSVLSLTLRQNYIWAPFARSKMIINPRKVEAMGVHHVYRGNVSTDVIPVDQGLLYHYRKPKGPCVKEVKDDRVAVKFGKRLLHRLRTIWSRLEGVALRWARQVPRNGPRLECSAKAKREKKSKIKKKQSKFNGEELFKKRVSKAIPK